MSKVLVLAFDLDASGGLAIIGKADLEPKSVEMEEIYIGFQIALYMLEDICIGMFWGWGEVKEGILRAYRRYGNGIASIGVDTWSVDFCVIG